MTALTKLNDLTLYRHLYASSIYCHIKKLSFFKFPIILDVFKFRIIKLAVDSNDICVVLMLRLLHLPSIKPVY